MSSTPFTNGGKKYSIFPYGKSPHGQQSLHRRKSLELYMEILDVQEPMNNDKFFATIKEAAKEYHVGEINIHGGLTDANGMIEVPGFPKLKQAPDRKQLADMRRMLLELKELGLSITLSGGEPRIPEDFLQAYPEAHNVSNGILWAYFEASTRQLFLDIPEADTVQFHLFETELLNDQNIFRDFWWAGDGSFDRHLHTGPVSIYTQADFVTELLAAFSRGAESAGGKFSLLTFCHYPYQERLVIESLRKLDHNFHIVLDHKCQPGDWDPFRPANNVMLEVHDRGPSKMKFDGVGEYWGQGEMPCCYPDEMQGRLIHALENNDSISSIGMRVHWEFDRVLFGKPNEINWYALYRLSKDPYTPIEDIWNDWAVERFGEKASGKVISALRRTSEIIRLSYYIVGAWAQQHSRMATLEYFIAQILHTGRAQMEWTPQHFVDNMTLRDIMCNPREHTVLTVVRDREEALRLCALSIGEIKSAKGILQPEKYEMLMTQFERLHVFVGMCIPHVEACMRCWVQMNNPSDDNLEKIELPIANLEKLARQMEDNEIPAHPLIPIKSIHDLVEEIRVFLDAEAKSQKLI